MVPKQKHASNHQLFRFRAVLFRMVPKLADELSFKLKGFRAVLFRMVPKHFFKKYFETPVLELCCFEWFQNFKKGFGQCRGVLELCCFEWFQNKR